MGTETFLKMILDTPLDDPTLPENLDQAKNMSKNTDFDGSTQDLFVNNNMLLDTKVELSKEEIKNAMIQSYLSPMTGYGKYNLIGTLTDEINNLLSKKKVKGKTHKKKKKVLPLDVDQGNQNVKSKNAKTSTNKISTNQISTEREDTVPRSKREWIPSDHRLDNTDNEYILAWIKQKDELAYKKKQEIRKERRKKKSSNIEKAMESEVRERDSKASFKRWLRIKRREEKLTKSTNAISALMPDEKVATDPSSNSQDSNANANHDSRETKANEIDNQNDKQVKVDKTSISVSKDQEPPLQTGAHQPNQRIRKKKAKKAKNNDKPSPRKSQENHENCSNDMLKKRISYDEWLKQKRTEENIKKKIEMDKPSRYDDQTGKLICKIAKNRVSKILTSKKKVDSGKYLDKVKDRIDNPYNIRN